MTRPLRCSSWLAVHFEAFVRLKRATGARYDSQVLLLEHFDRFVSTTNIGQPMSLDAVFDYLASLEGRNARSRDNVVSVLWQALEHARLHGAPVPPLPLRPRPAPPGTRDSMPRILSGAQTTALLKAARRLPPCDGLRSATTATLTGLLLATGIRIGEALALDVGDLDLEHRLLTVRRGKFGKSRLLPLRESTVAAIQRYVDDPHRPVEAAASGPLFVSARSHRLSYPTARRALRDAAEAAGIPVHQRPRPHDYADLFVMPTSARKSAYIGLIAASESA